MSTFSYVLGTQTAIRARMAQGSYTEQDHQEGLKLLCAACATKSGGFDLSQDDSAREAEDRLHAWASAHLPRLRAAIQRLHPQQLTLLADLKTESAAQSVLSVRKLLQRVEQEAPTDVRRTLARRGLNANTIEQLFELVVRVSSAKVPRELESTDAHYASAPSAGSVFVQNAGHKHVHPDLLALYLWYQDWVTTARVVVGRKDWLLRLGVIRKR